MDPRTAPLRLAVVGIDGSGKSLAHEALAGALGAAGWRVSAMQALEPDLGETWPLAQASREFAALSALGDRLGSPLLKAVGLFLGMTLHGPAELQMLGRDQPDAILTERHALVDSLVYGRHYLPLVQEALLGSANRIPDWPEGLMGPAARDWLATMGLEQDLVPLVEQLVAAFRLPLDERVAILAQWHGIGLPDLVVHLDIPPGEALRRIEARAAAAPTSGVELHEQLAALEGLQQAYRETLAELAAEPSGIEVISYGSEPEWDFSAFAREVVVAWLAREKAPTASEWPR